MTELSKETKIAISTYKVWAKANDRRDGFEVRNRAEERAQAQLTLAVREIPPAEFSEYVRITDEWEGAYERAKPRVVEP